MRSTRFPLTPLGPEFAFACLLGGLARAQLADDTAARRPPPLPGTYYSAQRPTFPPRPWNPFPDLPLYSRAERRFIYDDRAVDYSLFKSETAETAETAGPVMTSMNRSMMMTATGGCVPNLFIFHGSNEVILLVTNGTAGTTYELFATGCLVGDSMMNSLWRRVAVATNGQRLMFTAPAYRGKYFVVGCDTDSDGDELTDAYELLVTKTSPTNQHSVNALYTDKEMENVPVNDPEQDCGNEQNTQFETTVAVLGSNVIVAYVDSNRGVYGLGNDGVGYLTNYIPRLVGYAVSTNGGLSFEDKDVPPLDAAGFGDAGDPVLAVDASSNVVYLVGTSPRQDDGFKGIPFWKSVDGGLTFNGRTNIHEEIRRTDKPWIAVDDWPGTGRHDVYATCNGRTNTSIAGALWLLVSKDGQGGSWTNAPLNLRQPDGASVIAVNSPIVQVGSNHVASVFWYERTGAAGVVTNWIKMCPVSNRGASTGAVQVVAQLTTIDEVNGNLRLLRSNTATNTDTFKAFPFPVVALNPARNSQMYVAYADRGTNAADKADIYLVRSSDGGTNWTTPVRVNDDQTTNDQWMPVLAVKPDGSQLFLAWYDRRNDTNNLRIDVYGRFVDIATNGSVTFGTEFRISTTSFPPVFAGTDTNNIEAGHYDPVYPPGGVNLHWWYPEWPVDQGIVTDGAYRDHVGEYNGIAANAGHVYLSWTDGRTLSGGTVAPNFQRDIRLIRIRWPE